jgi:hypothetical protein
LKREEIKKMKTLFVLLFVVLILSPMSFAQQYFQSPIQKQNNWLISAQTEVIMVSVDIDCNNVVIIFEKHKYPVTLHFETSAEAVYWYNFIIRKVKLSK